MLTKVCTTSSVHQLYPLISAVISTLAVEQTLPTLDQWEFFCGEAQQPQKTQVRWKARLLKQGVFGGWKTTAGLNLDPRSLPWECAKVLERFLLPWGKLLHVCCMWVKLTQLHVRWKCARGRRSQLGGCLQYVHKIRCTHWIQIISGEKGAYSARFFATEPQSWAETVESTAHLRLKASRYYRKWPKSLDGPHGSSFPTFVNMDLRTLAWPQLLSFIISSVFTSDPGTSAFSFFPLRWLPAAQKPMKGEHLATRPFMFLWL